MFTTLIVQPIFNLLVFIYALLPGHNFGLALIIFTIVIRLLLWPLVKRQLHQTKLMRKIQPELKRIQQETKGDRQKQSMMLMELYKEKGINPLGALGPVFLQLPILFGLYLGLQRIVNDNNELINFSYSFIQNLPWMRHLAENIQYFDSTLFGLVDLTRPALSSGNVYWPALLIVLGSAVIQFFTSRQLLPKDKDARSLRAIMKEAGSGKQADQSEVNAAVGRSTQYLLPALIILFTIHLPSLLGLYWLVGGLVAFIQQAIVLRDDETEMEQLAAAPVKTKKTGKKNTIKDASTTPEAEMVATSPAPKKKKATKKKRRK